MDKASEVRPVLLSLGHEPSNVPASWECEKSSVWREVGRFRGGLDAFLVKAKDDELSVGALKVKKEIAKATAAAAEV